MSEEPLISSPRRIPSSSAAAEKKNATNATAADGLVTLSGGLPAVVPATTKSTALANLVWIVGPWLVGLLLGLLVLISSQRETTLPSPINIISPILGWIYFSAWSISFYPQLYLNYRRKSVVGLSLDFQSLNFLGFAAYAIYNCAFFFSSTVQQQYAAAHHGQLPAVHLNDVFFSVHALLATAVTLVQSCCVYERNGALPAVASIVAIASTAIITALWSAFILFSRHHHLTWLSLLYFLSAVKLCITLVKYIPQVVLNCRRKSTVGWNIFNVLLDFEGGLLSLVQQLMDAVACSDWTPLLGNPIKFALGFVSMGFDVVFAVQHFYLYPNNGGEGAHDDSEDDDDDDDSDEEDDDVESRVGLVAA